MQSNQKRALSISIFQSLLRGPFACVFLLIASYGYAIEDGTYYDWPLRSTAPPPWFTGPLFTPSGHVTPKGHINFEPYFFARDVTGDYDSHWHSHSSKPPSWELRSRNVLKIGILNRVDLTIIPQAFYKMKGEASSVQFGDLTTGFNFSIIKSNPELWYPSIKLTIFERFPTGKYQRGNPKKDRTDLVGRGCFETQFGITASKLFHIKNKHYLSSRVSINYFLRPAIHVKGFNSYGGGYGTSGVEHPGNHLSVSMGHEFSLTQHWSLACDFIYRHFNVNHFSGYKGTTTKGGHTPAKIEHPSSEHFSLAPALEYNFSQHLGLIGGVWVSVAGRNSSDVISGVIALNYFQ